jgi:transmembrane sensor
MASSDPIDPHHLAQEAAGWAARRDRGLSAAEQDEFVQWLAAHPQHAEALRRHTAAFERMMRLYEWQPGPSGVTNPDLFAPPRRRNWRRGVTALAAALVLAAGVIWWGREAGSAPLQDPSTYLRLNESRTLPDGTRVELKEGAQMAVRYSDAERRVVLFGEGHFDVAKAPGRDFVVEAGGALVRAVGTAFNVRLGQDAVEVLVTEGVVQVERPAARSDARSSGPAAPPARVEARHRAVIPLQGDRLPEAVPVTDAEMAEAMAWKAPRLQFSDTPLAVAVAEFNRRNRLQIVIAEPEISAQAIGGTFQVNNVEGFVRLLEVTLDVKAERRGTEIVLRRAP